MKDTNGRKVSFSSSLKRLVTSRLVLILWHSVKTGLTSLVLLIFSFGKKFNLNGFIDPCFVKGGQNRFVN